MNRFIELALKMASVEEAATVYSEERVPQDTPACTNLRELMRQAFIAGVLWERKDGEDE